MIACNYFAEKRQTCWHVGFANVFCDCYLYYSSILSFCEEENWYETQANIQPGELFIFLYLFVELFVVLREY